MSACRQERPELFATRKVFRPYSLEVLPFLSLGLQIRDEPHVMVVGSRRSTQFHPNGRSHLEFCLHRGPPTKLRKSFYFAPTTLRPMGKLLQVFKSVGPLVASSTK